MAHDGGKDGLAIMRRLLEAGAGVRLQPHGIVVIEVGRGFAACQIDREFDRRRALLAAEPRMARGLRRALPGGAAGAAPDVSHRGSPQPKAAECMAEWDPTRRGRRIPQQVCDLRWWTPRPPPRSSSGSLAAWLRIHRARREARCGPVPEPAHVDGIQSLFDRGRRQPCRIARRTRQLQDDLACRGWRPGTPSTASCSPSKSLLATQDSGKLRLTPVCRPIRPGSRTSTSTAFFSATSLAASAGAIDFHLRRQGPAARWI
ncbi:MAG: hypothetical protein MZV63_06215 [Marinilabiliales bacterium]|nr:hypothetical protein [Marinilabiliales bacterium]